MCVGVCVGVYRETATLPSPSPYQATKGLLQLSSIMLTVGTDQTLEDLAVTNTHTCKLALRRTHTNTLADRQAGTVSRPSL